MPTGLVSTKPRVLHGADGRQHRSRPRSGTPKDQEAFLADKLGAALAVEEHRRLLATSGTPCSRTTKSLRRDAGWVAVGSRYSGDSPLPHLRRF